MIAPHPDDSDATLEQSIRTLAVTLYLDQMPGHKDVERALHDAKRLMLDGLGDLTPDLPR